MISEIVYLFRKVFEKDEKTRRYTVDLADSYLRRIRRFQDQLVLLCVVLNFAAAGYVLRAPAEYPAALSRLLMASAAVILANALLAKLYSNEHRTTKLLFARYPELELIMVGDKSWSNFKVLSSAYKWVQSGWMLYSAVLARAWFAS